MPVDVKMYRMFLSSPDGLKAECESIKSFVRKYNDIEGKPRCIRFETVRWEDVPPEYGRRAQDYINDELLKCDYFVLILCDRWGSPPGVGEHGCYSSGTEEEFDLAAKCLETEDRDMKHVAVYFKNVERASMDALNDDDCLDEKGRQLKKVLEFKERLKKSKKILYGEFKDVGELQDRIWTHLAAWVRDHEARRETIGVRSVYDVADIPS